MKICKFYFILVLFIFHIGNAQWEPCNNGIEGAYVTAIAITGDKIFAGTLSNGVFLSTDNGKNWIKKSSGLTDLSINCIAVRGDNIFAGTMSGVFLSTDNGKSWKEKNYGLQNKNVMALIVKNDIIFAGIFGLGVFYSTDNGEKWQKKMPITESDLYSVFSLAIKGDKIFAGTKYDPLRDTLSRIYLSSDDGKTWVAKEKGLPNNISVICLAVKGEYLFAGSNNGLFLSSDDGESWTKQSNHLKIIRDIAVLGDNLYSATPDGIYMSTDNGKSWILKLNSISSIKIIVKGNDIIAGTSKGIYTSDDHGENWLKNNTGLTDVSIGEFVIVGSNIFAGGSSLFFSSDDGNNWSEKQVTGLESESFTGLVSLGGNIFVSSLKGIYMTSDLGNTWEDKNSGLSNLYIANLKVSENILFVCTYGSGIFQSRDNGNTWEDKNSGLTEDQKKDISRIAVNGQYIIAAKNMYSGVLLSTDSGKSWTSYDTIFSKTNIFSLTFNGNDIFAGGYSGNYFYSSDFGKTWVKINIDPGNKPVIYTMSINGRNILAGTINGVYFSSDYGINWNQYNLGLTSKAIYSFLIKGNYVFAGTSGGVFRARLSDFGISPVEEYRTEVKYHSNHFYSEPPYPTPSQSIVKADVYWDLSFDLSEAVQGVYNSQGILIESKENINITSSTRAPAQINWDCSNQPDGVYFIVIRHNRRTDCIPVLVRR